MRSDLVYVYVASHAIAAVIAIAIVSCGGGGKPLVPANPDGADCLAEREKQQLACVQKLSSGLEIDKCRAEVKARINCTTEAGVAAFVSQKDGSP